MPVHPVFYLPVHLVFYVPVHSVFYVPVHPVFYVPVDPVFYVRALIQILCGTLHFFQKLVSYDILVIFRSVILHLTLSHKKPAFFFVEQEIS